MGNAYERGPRLGSYWGVEGGNENFRILEQNFRITNSVGLCMPSCYSLLVNSAFKKN